jgi:hypothetical protein
MKAPTLLQLTLRQIQHRDQIINVAYQYLTPRFFKSMITRVHDFFLVTQSLLAIVYNVQFPICKGTYHHE